jgi:hypothetical protein
MTSATRSRQLLTTVDVRDLNTLRWGPLRHMFPGFAEEIELGRYLKSILSQAACRTVQIEPHCAADGRASTHVYDVFIFEET